MHLWSHFFSFFFTVNWDILAPLMTFVCGVKMIELISVFSRGIVKILFCSNAVNMFGCCNIFNMFGLLNSESNIDVFCCCNVVDLYRFVVVLTCCVAVLQCLPLWPENTSGKLCIRVVGSESTSKFFFFNCQDNGTLLSLDRVSVSDWPITTADFNPNPFRTHLRCFVCVCSVWWGDSGG